jgi:AhpD family alkylhydroperoxidase
MSTARVTPGTGLQARLAVWAGRRQLGPEIADSAAIYARHPRLLRWFALFDRQVEREAHVPEALRALATLKAATVAECEFCIDIGSELARRSGLSDAQLLALHDPRPSGLFSPLELQVIAYARGLSVSPTEVDDATAGAVRDALGESGFMELTYLIAWENLRARLNSGLGIEPGGFSTGKACALPASAAAGVGTPAAV